MSGRQHTAPVQHYTLLPTAIGNLAICWGAAGLRYLQLPEADDAATEARLLQAAGSAIAAEPSAVMRRVFDELTAYCQGEAVSFDRVALDLEGVPAFAGKVYAAARAIAWGRTASYGELARRIGQPGAARAVGGALGSNPVPIIIPCHRVLASGGKIGGFSAYRGASTKRRLLALEGVRPNARGMPELPGLLPPEH